MGKFVIIPSHPSNDFFAQFPNCLTYATKEEFVGNLYYAMTHAPAPLTEDYAYALSWQAATQRLVAAACIPKEESEKMNEFLASEDAGIEVRTGTHHIKTTLSIYTKVSSCCFNLDYRSLSLLL